MATTRIIPMHINKGKTIAQCLSDRINYSENPEKTNSGELVSSYECDPKTADAELLLSKRQYRVLTGRVQANDVIAYQIRQSFKPGEITPEDANKIGYNFALHFTKGDHAFIVCTHVDKEHIHNHIIWNSTALDCKRKFRNFWGSTEAVRRLSDTICMEHKLSVINNPKPHGQSYNKWLGSRLKPSNRDMLRAAIDAILAKKPVDFNEFLSLMQSTGYSCKRGKNLTFSHDGQRSIRLSSLGDGYSEADIRAVISGGKAHKPSKRKSVMAVKPTLLSQIEAKLNSGRGCGYEQWAKVFRLKEMAKTVLYLQEHNYADVGELQTAVKSVGERYHALSKQIKAAEARMVEIAALKTHIINYSKTRGIYDGYRKSGYSKQYLAEHESDIIIHKAAKKAFDELGAKKLPTVNSLQQEYSSLLSEKKAAYAEYRKVKSEMRDLQIYRANIEHILSTDTDKDGQSFLSQREE